jgi:hypothetical protein
MAYIAVGTKTALASAIGLPSKSTSALWMLGLLIPAEVRSSFMIFFDYIQVFCFLRQRRFIS